jgi:hypothetical protein
MQNTLDLPSVFVKSLWGNVSKYANTLYANFETCYIVKKNKSFEFLFFLYIYSVQNLAYSVYAYKFTSEYIGFENTLGVFSVFDLRLRL